MQKSVRLQHISPSVTVSLNSKVVEMKARGEDIIALNAGEPDFPTPPSIVEACKKALDQGKTKYINNAGIPELRKAISQRLSSDHGVHYAPQQICVSTGAKQALNNAVLAVVNPGQEVIIPTPAWVSYVEIVKLAGGVPILVPSYEVDDFRPDLIAIRRAITPKTVAILINNPHNPTGAVYTEEDLVELADIALEHQLWVISDEVYEKLVYGNARHTCFSRLSADAYARTILVNGFSKAYSMTGWRIGYTAAPFELAGGIDALQSHVTSNSTTFVQYGALEALADHNDSGIERMRLQFEARHDAMLQRWQKIPGIIVAPTQGAFYFMPNISAYFGKRTPNGQRVVSSGDLCTYLLEEGKVALVPGEAFFAPNHLRVSYANSMENLMRGMDRVTLALAKLL